MHTSSRIAFCLLASLLLLGACQKPVLESEISVDPGTLIFAAASPEAVSVSVSSNSNWTADVSGDWISLSRNEGEFNADVEVRVEPNLAAEGSAAEGRKGYVIFRAGAAEAVLNVEQNAESVVLAVDGNAEVPAEGATVKVTVEYNSAYTVSIPADASWITQVGSKAVATETLSFLVEANTSTATRSAEITFTSASTSGSVLITQAGVTPGIRTAEDFVNFAKAVNEGNASAYDFDGDGVFTLEDDIDLSGVAWTPIGKPAATVSIPYNTANVLGNAFTGVFDGKGHTIRNLSMSVDIQSTQVMGLFGVLNGANVRNLVIEDAKLTVSGSGISSNHVALGIVAGQTADSQIENVQVKASISGSASSTASRSVPVGGITGLLVSGSKVSHIKDCSFDGSITLNVAEKYSNTNTTGFAGIVGFVSSGSKLVSVIENCVNDATINVGSHRAAGIVCNAFLAEIKDCVNNGAITCNYAPGHTSSVSGVRMGGILSYCSDQSDKGQKISGCTNTALISTEEAGSVAGGVCGLIKCFSVSDCRNTGSVICPEKEKGLLIGVLQASTTVSTISNCAVRGSLASKADFSDAVAATASNYFKMAATIVDGQECPTLTEENIKYIGTLDGPGISSAAEFVEFAKAWNAAESIAKWQDADFVVNLLSDIDCSEITAWEPVGKASFTWASNVLTISGTPFTGHFDGNGFSIKNLKLTGSPAAGDAFGIFGALSDGAIVQNLTIDSSSSAEFTPTATSDCGIIAGLVCDASVINVTNNAPIKGKVASDNKRQTVAMIGFAYSKNAETLIENVTNNGKVEVDGSGNTNNGATGVHTAGIAGFSSNESNATTKVLIKNCVNNGDIVSSGARASGILAAANRYTDLLGCVNNGTNTNSYATSGGGRIGNITCITGAGSTMKNCTNNGDLISTTNARVGGLVSLVNSDDNAYEFCTNTGRIISDNNQYCGTVFGYCNVGANFKAIIAKGDVGTWNNGTPAMVGLNESNYIDHIGAVGAKGINANAENIWWDMKSGYDPGDVTLPTMKQAVPSKWAFTSSGTSSYTSYWTSKLHCVPATDGTAGLMTAVRGEANKGADFTYTVTGGKPYIRTMLKDDYLLFSFPDQNIAAGSYVQFDANIGCSTNSHKYFVVEFLDGGQWKSVEADLRSASEDSSLKYTFRNVYTSSYQHACVNQIYKFNNAVSDTLKVRLRAVGSYTCSGVTESVSTSSSDIYIPVFGFSGVYVQNLGTITPKKNIRILCLGNSFSYYYNPTWYLEEIAAKEGLIIDMVSHTKGSQTLENHCSLAQSTEVINAGGYDYAFIQDQSQNPAKFAQDPSTNASVKTYCKTLSDKIRAVSPSCKVILENTWSFSSSTYGGFDSYSNFDALLASGCQQMASNAGDWISPIGQAFAACRAKYPSYGLNYSDNKHQSAYGAYLKACVNYLVLSGQKFGSSPADCGIDATVAANLRAIAEETVLGNESNYLIAR